MHRLVAIAVVLGAGVAHSDVRTAQAIWSDADRATTVAEYSRAANLYEEYAARFSTEPNTFEALSRAIKFRAALGDTAKWRTDVNLAMKLYAKARPGDVAALVFDLRAAFEGVTRSAHLRDYLRVFNTRGGVDRALFAHVELGTLAWERACPKAIDGFCVRRIEAHPDSCMTGHLLASVPRDAALATQAIADFTEAIRLLDATPALKTDKKLVAAYATAKLALADAEFEALLAVPFPKMHFRTPSIAKRSQQRVQKFLTIQMTGGRQLTETYEAIARLDPSRAIAVAARLGQHTRLLAKRFLAAPQPKDIRDRGDDILADAYCDSIVTHTDALSDRAEDTFIACLHKAITLDVYDSWAKLCERELAAEKPKEWPLLREKLPPPPSGPPTFLVVGRVNVALEREPQQ